MIRPITRLLFLLLSVYGPFALADALMLSQALKSSTIAQYYIDEKGVRIDLEVGWASVKDFRNLMPDELYENLGNAPRPLEERIPEFFEKDLAILVDGMPLNGYIIKVAPARRVLRDPIVGTPLAIQDDAPEVLRVDLFYPFPENERPDQLQFIAPTQAEIGFVVYHKGVAVNDYKYLNSGYTLDLDWSDPWYSRFNVRGLNRRYSAPMSGFIYVEHFEVRKEIIVRPKDLQRWVDLGLEDRNDIPVDMQADIKEKVGAFLSQHHQVTIDGEKLDGVLESVNFLERTLTSSRVIDPPELLDLDAAIMGAIFVYPRNGLPKEVLMDWDLWDDRIQRIPVSAVDEAGPLPSYLEPDWPQLEWKNFLTNPQVPTLYAVQPPVEPWRQWLSLALPVIAVLALLSVLWLWRRRSAGAPAAIPALASVVLVATGVAAAQFGASNQPKADRAESIVGDLLHNIYRAFDYREEADIYDVLSQSVSGELLTDIFLETKRSLVLANQGGAQAKVKDVVLESVDMKPAENDDSFTVEADWVVNGSVGHWGHVHKRSNRYLAELRIAVDGDQWKLQDMTVLQEERL